MILFYLSCSVAAIVIALCWREFISTGNKDEVKIVNEGKKSPIIMAYIMPKEGAFNGYDLLQVLTICDLRYDASSQIFHKYSSDETILFSLACSSEPGIFDMSALGSRVYDGVVLFLEIDNVAKFARSAVEQFIDASSHMAEELNAKVINSRKEIIGDDEILLWRTIADNKSQKFGTLDMFDGV